MIARQLVQCRQRSRVIFRSSCEGLRYQSKGGYISCVLETLTKPSTTVSGISSPLLKRAESLALEHKKLSQQIQNEYDGNITKRIGELAPISKAWQQWDSANKVLISQNPKTKIGYSQLPVYQRASRDSRRSNHPLRTPPHRERRDRTIIAPPPEILQLPPVEPHSPGPLCLPPMPPRNPSRRRRLGSQSICR